jgi:hypothetical protein
MNTPTPFHVLTPVLQQAQKNGWYSIDIDEVEKLLVKIRNVSLIQSLLDQGYPPSTKFIYYASYAGCLDLVQFAKDHRFPVHYRTICGAAEGGHIDCLEYLLKTEAPLSSHQAENILDSCIHLRDIEDDGINLYGYRGRLNSFAYLMEHGFRDDLSSINIDCIWGFEVLKCAEKQDYSFRLTNYLVQQGILDETNIIWRFNKLSVDYYPVCLKIDYRRALDENPTFRRICFSDRVTSDLLLSLFITRLRACINGEKEESKVLEEFLSIDIIKYVIWPYL